MARFSHLDAAGRAQMVDVGKKADTEREAVARGAVTMRPSTARRIRSMAIAKGDVLGVARVAAIQGAKETSRIIPLCHPLSLTGIDVHLGVDARRGRVAIEARVRTVGKTGVEMEALTAVAAAALTIYDLCKAVDREMVIGEICLVEKRGGRSGAYRRSER